MKCLGYGPLTVTVGNEGLGWDTKNVIILVVTITVRGPHPRNVLFLKWSLFGVVFWDCKSMGNPIAALIMGTNHGVFLL